VEFEFDTSGRSFERTWAGVVPILGVSPAVADKTTLECFSLTRDDDA